MKEVSVFKGVFGRMKGLGFVVCGGDRVGEYWDLLSEGLEGGSGVEKGQKGLGFEVDMMADEVSIGIGSLFEPERETTGTRGDFWASTSEMGTSFGGVD